MTFTLQWSSDLDILLLFLRAHVYISFVVGASLIIHVLENMASTATSSREQRCPPQPDLHQILYFLVILKFLDLHSSIDINPTRLKSELLYALPDVHERSHTATGGELLRKPDLEIEDELQVVRVTCMSSLQCSDLAFAIPYSLPIWRGTLRQGSRICKRQGSAPLRWNLPRLGSLKIGTWIGYSLPGSQRQKREFRRFIELIKTHRTTIYRPLLRSTFQHLTRSNRVTQFAQKHYGSVCFWQTALTLAKSLCNPEDVSLNADRFPPDNNQA